MVWWTFGSGLFSCVVSEMRARFGGLVRDLYQPRCRRLSMRTLKGKLSAIY
jgi:hypothetical protein